MYKKLIEDVNQIVNLKFNEQNNTLSGYQIYEELVAKGHIEEIELSEGMLDQVLSKIGDKFPKSQVRVKLQQLEKQVGKPGFEKVLDRELLKAKEEIENPQKTQISDPTLQKYYISALRLLLDKQTGRLARVGQNSGISKYQKQMSDREPVASRIV